MHSYAYKYVGVCWIEKIRFSHMVGGPCTPEARLVCSNLNSRHEERKKQQKEKEQEEVELEK